MRRILPLMTALAVIVLLIGCGTISDVVGEKAKDVISEKAEAAPTTKPAATIGGVDFKPDEVLCARYEDPLIDNRFYVAKILTPASAQTKDQAEVLLVGSGEKHWSIAVIPSHKAGKEELILGNVVFYCYYYNHEDVTDEKYRKETWYLGRISSTDELFKDVVEVKGNKMFVQWIRIPEQPVE